MSDDATAGPSLLLARHDLAHREHQHLHQHHKLHRRQDDTKAAVVTEVVATISVVQQINVDANGSTFSMILLPVSTDSSPAITVASPTTTTPSSPSAVNDVASTVPSTATGTDSTNSAAQLPLSLSTSSSASAPIATPSIPSTFSSLIVSTNSTTLISSSSSRAFSNSTRSSSRSSLTYLKTLSSSTTIDPKYKSTSSYYPITSSLLPTSTDAGVFIAGGTGAAGSGGPSVSTSAADSSSGSGSEPDTPTPVIIGSVVSSVAGAAVIILAILFIWRWRKGKSRNMLSLGSGGALGAAGVQRLDDGDAPQPSGGMVERRSFAYAVPAALASLTGYKRSSQKTERTISSTAGSERGFYRVSGRKLPSVLQSGGDGYGGGIDDVNHANTLSGSSFYLDSQSFYGGPGSPSFPTVLGISTQRDSGVPVSRPSPARTPVIEHGPFSSVPSPLIPPTRPDVLGRSHPSQDGSHTSRFTEEV